MFEDEEFDKALKQIIQMDLDGFEFFVESHGVKVYRQYFEESGLYKYKVFGEIDVNPETCSDVYMDVEYRKSWDGYALELYKHQCDESKPTDEFEVIYWQVKFPWPMSNRDYFYVRQLKTFEENGQKTYVILGKSVNDVNYTGVKEVSGVIRVTDYLQSMVITDNGKGGTKAYLEYYDDPRGSIPTWLINWAAKSGVPEFLQTMQDACKGYKEWKATNTS